MCWPDYAASLLLLLMSLLMQHVAMHFIILLSIVMRTMKTMNERGKNVSIAKNSIWFWHCSEADQTYYSRIEMNTICRINRC